jgi:hypothetical protein
MLRNRPRAVGAIGRDNPLPWLKSRVYPAELLGACKRVVDQRVPGLRLEMRRRARLAVAAALSANLNRIASGWRLD